MIFKRVMSNPISSLFASKLSIIFNIACAAFTGYLPAYHRSNPALWGTFFLWRRYAGRYPVKAAQAILKIVDSLEANSEDIGLDITRLKITHAASQKARVLKRYIPRAFGRSSPHFDHLCHIELIAQEI